MATATHAVNERQIDRLLRLVGEYASVNDTVAVMGLSYKPGTNVIEQSQGVMLAAALAKAGRRVIAHDPLAMDAASAVLGSEVSFAGSPEEAVAKADAVVVMVPWPEYDVFFGTWQGCAATRVIIDCWRLVNRQTASAAMAVVQLGLNEPGEAQRASEAIAAAN